MKNLLVPAAIAISGFFVVSNIADYDSVNCLRPSTSKHDQARHHRQFINQDVDAVANEVPANAIKVVNFAPVTEEVASFFFIDFSDEQSKNSDMEINSQMEANMVEISVPDSKKGDLEINGQMEKSFVTIETPSLNHADQYIEKQFAQDILDTLKFVAVDGIVLSDNEVNGLFENGLK
jgi:hypothetical protein